MTIIEFINCAIEGGWKNNHGISGIKPQFIVYSDTVEYGVSYVRWDTFPNQPMEGQKIRHSDMFLDPQAWRAVGKVRKFGAKDIFHDDDCKNRNKACAVRCGKTNPRYYSGCYEYRDLNYKGFMYLMVDALCSGKTIESFLESL